MQERRGGEHKTSEGNVPRALAVHVNQVFPLATAAQRTSDGGHRGKLQGDGRARHHQASVPLAGRPGSDAQPSQRSLLGSGLGSPGARPGCVVSSGS